MYLKDFLKLVANRNKVWIVLNDLDECNGIFNSLALDLKKDWKVYSDYLLLILKMTV